MITPKAIISDADGTLVDTLHLIRHGQYETAKNYLIQKEINPSHIPDYETYEKLINKTVGGSARDTLEKTVSLLYKDKPGYLQTINFDDLHENLDMVQDKIAPDFVKGYKGLAPFLKKLGELNIMLAIFTSGTPHHIVRNFGTALPELKLTDLYKSPDMTDFEKLRLLENNFKAYFLVPDFTVVTCNDVVAHKPDPASLVLAMQRIQVTPKESMVLGDHAVDMQAGINANVPVRIGITHGFNDDRELIDAGATKIVHGLDELTYLLS